jgi:tight adherence protein B
MLVSVVFLTSLAAFLLVLSFFCRREERKEEFERRLKRAKEFSSSTQGESRVEEWLSQAGITLLLNEFYFLLVTLGTLGFTVGLIAGLPFMLALFLGALPCTGVLGWLSFKAKGRQLKLEKQLEQALLDMASALRTTPSLLEAVKVAVEGVDDPLRGELQRLLREIRFGIPVDEALKNLAKRNRSDILDLAVESMILSRTSGSRLVVLLERAAEVARSGLQMKEEIHSLSSQPRSTAIVVALIPIVFIVFIWFLNPGYLSYLRTPLGHLALIYAAISFSVGFYIMYRMTDLTPGGRR